MSMPFDVERARFLMVVFALRPRMNTSGTSPPSHVPAASRWAASDVYVNGAGQSLFDLRVAPHPASEARRRRPSNE